MKKRHKLLLMRATLLLLIGLLVIHPIAVSASILGSVSQYSTPSGNWQARSMTVGPDGNVWSAATNARKIAKTTSLGVTTEYTLPTGYKTPQNIINGPYGSLWFSAFKQNVNTYSNTYSIGKISTNGVMSFYDLPIPSDRTTYFSSVMSIDVVDGIVWVVREYSKYVQKLTINGAASSVALLKLDKPDEVPAASYNSTNALYVAQSLRYNPKDGYVYIFSKERDNSNSTLGHYVERYSQSGDHNIYSLGYTMSDFYMVSKVVVDMSGRLWFLGGSSSTGNEIGYLDPQTDTTNLYSMPNNDYFVGSITVGADGNIWATERNTVNSGANGKVASVNIDTGAIDEYNLPSDSQYPYGIVASIDNNLWISHYGVNKIQKFGIGDISGFIDNDSDNLALQDELKQGTSDYSPDTDNDGITDYVESPNYTGRNNLFCNTSITNCEYPDPLTRDIYVEVDWMYVPATDVEPGYSTQPDGAKISWVTSAYRTAGIAPHIDVGQIGGGNETPYNKSINFYPTTGVVDLFDYRDGGENIGQQFSLSRRGVWRYALMGYQLGDLSGTSGASLVSTDSIFVSYGLIEDEFNYSSFDVAIAGTLMHELGHTLCLQYGDGVSRTYPQQSLQCQYQGIDRSSKQQYYSSLNYLYQMQLAGYSYGNIGIGTEDHDDWGSLSLKDFSNRDAKQLLSQGLTIEQSKQCAAELQRNNIKFEVTDTTIKVVKNGKEIHRIQKQNSLK